MSKLNGVFFGQGARALMLTFTVYSKITDWWINVNILIEYGIGNQVILARKDFVPFRPHIYETELERKFFFLDLTRLFCNISISLAHAITGCIKLKNLSSNFKFSTISSVLFELFILFVFIGQAILMYF